VDTTSVWRVALDPLEDSSSAQCVLLSLDLTSLYMSAAQIVSFDAFVSSSVRIIGARSVFRNTLRVLPLCTGASRYTTIFIGGFFVCGICFFYCVCSSRSFSIRLRKILSSVLFLCAEILSPAVVAMQCVYVWLTPFILSSDAKTARTLGSEESCCGAAWMTPLLHLLYQNRRSTNWCIAVTLPSWLWLHRFLKNRHIAAPVLSRPVFFKVFLHVA
jgi:hypothetical protein